MKRKYIESTILISFLPILTILLLIGIYNTSIKYKTIITTSIISITLILTTIIRLYLSKKITNYNIGQFMTIAINILLIFSIYNINHQYNYLENIINNKYIYTKNDIIVLKNTKYRNINELKNKKIGILETNYQNSKKLLNERHSKIIYISYKSKEDMINALNKGEIQAILLNENELNILKSNRNSIIKETRSIYKVKIKSEI